MALSRLAAVDFRARLRAATVRLDRRTAELGVRASRTLAAKGQLLEKLLVQLEERSPLRLLERGYAICYDASGNVVQSADQVALGERIRVQLARGRLGAEVKDKEKDKESGKRLALRNLFLSRTRRRKQVRISYSSVEDATLSTAKNASCGMSTRPTRFMRRLPSFCFSSSLRLRLISPP